MSNIFESKNIEKDFEAFQKSLVKTNIFKFAITPLNEPSFNKYHRLSYVIALIESKLENQWREENKYLFVNEILSDLLVNSSLCLIGFYSSSKILTRRIIENFYNHIYYYDHPIEYVQLNMGKNEYTSFNELKNYYESHPIFKIQPDKFIKIQNDHLYACYQELCKTVHTKGELFMGLAKNLDEIKPEYDLVEHLTYTNNILISVIYLMFKFHRDVTFTPTETDLVAKSIPKNMRSDLLA